MDDLVRDARMQHARQATVPVNGNDHKTRGEFDGSFDNFFSDIFLGKPNEFLAHQGRRDDIAHVFQGIGGATHQAVQILQGVHGITGGQMNDVKQSQSGLQSFGQANGDLQRLIERIGKVNRHKDVRPLQPKF